MKNKIKIGICSIVILALIISGIYLWNISRSGFCGSGTEVGCGSPCYSESGFLLDAVNSKDFENCKNFKQDFCIDYCRFKIAAYSDNPNNCEKIQDVEYKDLCYRYLAISLKDISLCAKQSESNAAQSKDLCETLYYREYGYPEK